MLAPIAPIAPKAKLSTPVVRYRTSSPVPDMAYTAPNASPEMRNGNSCDVSNISGSLRWSSSVGRSWTWTWSVGEGPEPELLLGGPRLDQRFVESGDLEAVLERNHL